MKRILAALSITAVMSSAAFAGAEFLPSTYTTYKKHSPNTGSIRVLQRLPADELSYTEIGMVRVSTKSISDYYQAIDEIKAAAAKHGGTAIVLSDDAKIYSAGGMTASGTTPKNVSAIAVIQH